MKNFINEVDEEEDYCYGNDDYGEHDECRFFFFSLLCLNGEIIIPSKILVLIDFSP